MSKKQYQSQTNKLKEKRGSRNGKGENPSTQEKQNQMIDARVPKTLPFCTSRHEPRCARSFQSNEPRKRRGTKVQWESWTSPRFYSSSSLAPLLSY
jgi:hypothetical protein